MNDVADMPAEQLAAYICETLRRAGITVTLTGGACVAIWSEGKYVSRDLDFIEEGPVPRRQVKAALASIGFKEQERYFVHPDSEFFVEFPTGPLTVGDERVRNVATRDTASGTLRLLNPTDCVKDRLAAYYHWYDKQSLEQAILVATSQDVDLADLRKWSDAEGAADRFASFLEELKSTTGHGSVRP